MPPTLRGHGPACGSGTGTPRSPRDVAAAGCLCCYAHHTVHIGRHCLPEAFSRPPGRERAPTPVSKGTSDTEGHRQPQSCSKICSKAVQGDESSVTVNKGRGQRSRHLGGLLSPKHGARLSVFGTLLRGTIQNLGLHEETVSDFECLQGCRVRCRGARQVFLRDSRGETQPAR